MYPDDDELTDPGETAESKMLAQLPAEAPEPPYNGASEFPALNFETTYSAEPPNLRTVALMKDKYNNRIAAMVRAKELSELRNEKIYRVFETARSWVVNFYTPRGPGEGFR